MPSERRRGWTARLPTWKRLENPNESYEQGVQPEAPQPPSSPDLSVVICTFNRADLLRGALQTLDTQFYSNSRYEIVVVDDGSSDHTRDVVQELAGGLRSDLCYIYQPNRGRAAARNVGIQNARGEYILFVDDDILAPPDLIEQHMHWHRKHRRTVVRGPIKIISEYEIPKKPNTTWRDYSTAMFCTCNASTSKYALLQVGGFDEKFVEYGFEDNELGWRLREKGYVARFNQKAIVYHYKPPLKRGQLQEMVQRAEEMGRSAVAYHRKHRHWKVALATGLHPMSLLWNSMLHSSLLNGVWMHMWQDGDAQTPALRAFLEERIFKFHYFKSMREALRKRD
ncbi:MAG: glycosyltransferase family 2 protein [Candidatus Xenobia bacterium]